MVLELSLGASGPKKLGHLQRWLKTSATGNQSGVLELGFFSCGRGVNPSRNRSRPSVAVLFGLQTCLLWASAQCEPGSLAVEFECVVAFGCQYLAVEYAGA